MTPARHTPTSTYRLQLEPDFPFAAATEIVPYVADLGISHLHLSPVLEAVPGSGHGYDVTDHARVRRELGGEEGLRRLSAAARAEGLGLIVDIVPNHMAVPARAELNGPLWRCCGTGRGRRARAGSTSTGRPAAAGCCCRCSAGRWARSWTGSPWRTASCGTPTARSRCVPAPRNCRCPSCSTPSTTASPGGGWAGRR